MTNQPSKELKKEMHDILDQATRKELEKALNGLYQEFTRWHSGSMDADKLAFKIKEYQEGLISQIYNRYSDRRNSNLVGLIGLAINNGDVSMESLSDELQDFVAPILSGSDDDVVESDDGEMFDGPLKELNIDWFFMEEAITNHCDEVTWHLHTDTGRLYMHSEFGDSDIEDSDTHLLQVEPINSRDEFKIMEAFAHQCSNELLKERLYVALIKDKPFANFRDVLHYYPEDQVEWNRFHSQKLQEHTQLWLKGEGYKAFFTRAVV